MIHNNKVYANADEKYVKATIVYAKESKLYHDVECTKPVLTTEVKEMFFNNMAIEQDDIYLIPYGLSPAGVLVRDVTGFVTFTATEPEVETEE